MAADPKREIRGDEDPYEFEWPDDAQALRAAEREQALKRESRPLAPRMLTAWAIGVVTQLVFFFIVLSVGSAFEPLMQLIAPTIVIATVFALPIGLALERVTRSLRPRISQAVFIFVGMALGFGWTFTIITAFPDYFEVGDGSLETARDIASVFMLTSVGAAFFLARAGADWLRQFRTAVYAMVALIAASFVASVAWYATTYFGA